MTSAVEIVPFTWGRKQRQKALELEAVVLDHGIFRFRPLTLSEVAAEVGIDLNPQRAGWLVRKYWSDWHPVPVHNGTVYVHESKYRGTEAEIELAKHEGLFDPRSHKNRMLYQRRYLARAKVTRH